MSNSPMIHEAMEFVRSHYLVGYGVAASAAILVYDYLCTLELEVQHVWLSLSLNRIGVTLFLFNRYLPFIDTFFSLHRELITMSPMECTKSVRVITAFTVMGTLVTQMVLYMRIYAMWEGRRALMFLFIAVIAAVAIALAVTSVELHSFRYVTSPVPMLPGCNLLNASRVVFIVYILLILSETGILVLTLIKIWPLYRRCHSPLILHLYRDGIMFYFMMLCFSIANVFVLTRSPPEYTNIMATPQRVFHSLLTTRVLLVRATYGQKLSVGDTTVRFIHIGDVELVPLDAEPEHVKPIGRMSYM